MDERRRGGSGLRRAGLVFVEAFADAFVEAFALADAPVPAPDPARGLEPEDRRLRLVANAGAAYCGTELKSNVDGIGSGSCFSVPYVTTITLWSSSAISRGSPEDSSPPTKTRSWFV